MTRNAHCGYCGAAFVDQTWPRTCAACRRTTYRNPTPVAVCLVPIDGGGLLCVRRAIPPRVGMLALPGGYVDFAETWQQAAARELFEETGLQVDPGEIEHIATLSSDRGDGVLLVFGRARSRPVDVLADFKPTAETAELVVIAGATELAFPLHTEVVAGYFAGRNRG